MRPRAALGEVREVLVGTGRGLRGTDLSSAAATLTYFSGIAIGAWMLLAVWTTSWGRGADDAARRLRELAVLLPDDMGARTPYTFLAEAGTHLGVLGAVVLLFPASFYGEGLRRAALTLDPREERFTGWRSRAAVLPLAVVLPALAWGWFAVADLMVPLAPEGGGGGVGDLLLRIVIGFHATWLALSVVLAWVYATVMPAPPRPAATVVGGLVTAAFLAGFLQGFQLFLAIPIDVGLPFAGLTVLGAVVAVGLWLYVLHTVVLVGWAFTRAVGERLAEGGQP